MKRVMGYNSKILIAVFIILIVFASCSIISQLENMEQELVKKNIAEENEIQLEIYVWDDMESYIIEVIDRYEEDNMNITINLHSFFKDDYNDEIENLLLTDKQIDIIAIRGTAQLQYHRETGDLYELTDKIKHGELDVTAYGTMFNTITYDYRHYALPVRSTCWVLYYNTELFDKAGLDYPEQLTWTEYGELAKKLTKGEGEEKQYGGYWVPWVYPFYAIQKGSYLYDDDLTEIEDSIKLLYQFYNIDKSHMSYADMDATGFDVVGEFQKGTIAMMPNGEWCVRMLRENEKEGETDIDWEIAPMPVPEGIENNTTWGQFEFMGIHSESDYREEAFAFLTYLCGQEGSEILAQCGMISAYKNEEAIQIYKDVVGKESVSIFFDTKKVQEQPAIKEYADLMDSFKLLTNQYLSDDKTLEETMKDFNDERVRIFHGLGFTE